MTIHASAQYPSSITLPTVVPQRVSTTTTPKLKYATTKVGQGNRLDVTVAGGSTPTGQVAVFVNGVQLTTVPLAAGAASVALPARKRAGKVAVLVKYLGDAYHLPSQKAVTWTVTRR